VRERAGVACEGGGCLQYEGKDVPRRATCTPPHLRSPLWRTAAASERNILPSEEHERTLPPDSRTAQKRACADDPPCTHRWRRRYGERSKRSPGGQAHSPHETGALWRPRRSRDGAWRPRRRSCCGERAMPRASSNARWHVHPRGSPSPPPPSFLPSLPPSLPLPLPLRLPPSLSLTRSLDLHSQLRARVHTPQVGSRHTLPRR
jgi:hypothetical protein